MMQAGFLTLLTHCCVILDQMKAMQFKLFVYQSKKKFSTMLHMQCRDDVHCSQENVELMSSGFQDRSAAKNSLKLLSFVDIKILKATFETSMVFYLQSFCLNMADSCIFFCLGWSEFPIKIRYNYLQNMFLLNNIISFNLYFWVSRNVPVI